VQQLTLVRLRLAQGRHDPAGPCLREASDMLAQLLPAAEAKGWARHVIEILALQALGYQAQGDLDGALTALARALTLAAPEGYVRMFVDEGAPIAALLALLVSRALPTAPYAATLLAAFPEGGTAPSRAALPTPDHQAATRHPELLLDEPLSVRELEILRLIAAGHSNQAIADTLIIAVSTAKKHVNNIFGKLEVQSRTQALMRARALNLL
jgi:LuxR family maltose regulon positive regulatory protein